MYKLLCVRVAVALYVCLHVCTCDSVYDGCVICSSIHVYVCVCVRVLLMCVCVSALCVCVRARVCNMLHAPWHT